MSSQRILFSLTLAFTVVACECATAQTPQLSSSLSFVFAGGYRLLEPDELNNAVPAELGFDGIKNGFTYSGGLRVGLSERLSLTAKAGYFMGSSKKDFIVTGENSPEPLAVFEEFYKVSSVPVSLGVGYSVPVGKVNLQTELAAEYHFAKVSYKPLVLPFSVPSYGAEVTNGGFGFRLAVGPEWRLMPQLSFNGKVGYRFAKISDFGYEVVTLRKYDLDLSGFFFEAGILVHP